LRSEVFMTCSNCGATIPAAHADAAYCLFCGHARARIAAHVLDAAPATGNQVPQSEPIIESPSPVAPVETPPAPAAVQPTPLPAPDTTRAPSNGAPSPAASITSTDIAASAAPGAHTTSTRRFGGRSSRVKFEVGLLRPLLAAAVTAGVACGVLFLIESMAGASAFTEKLLHRGWTPYAAVFLTCWALAILSIKAWRARSLRAPLSIELLPPSFDLASENGLRAAIAHVRGEARTLKDNTLARRIVYALERYSMTRSSQEVTDVLQADNDADQAEFEASYSLVRAFLWTIPILGFIGTVVGVGQAVGGFASFLSQAQEIDQIKGALSGVTSSLSLAFDTTLVALVLSVLIVIALSTVEKMEGGLLQEYDEYVRARVGRLPSQPAPVSESEAITSVDVGLILERLPELMNQSLRTTLAEFVPGVEFWRGEAQALAVRLANLVAAPIERFVNETSSMAARVQASVADLHRLHTQERDHVMEVIAAQKNMIQDTRRQLLEVVEKQQGVVDRFAPALLEVGTRLDRLISLQIDLEAGLVRAAGSDGLAAVLGNVKELLEGLRPPIQRLATEPLDVAVRFVAAPAVAATR
jgi:hypothetical protein